MGSGLDWVTWNTGSAHSLLLVGVTQIGSLTFALVKNEFDQAG